MFYLFSPNMILIAAAIVPAAALMVYVYRADRMEPEPTGLLISLVLLGILATGFAKITESLGMRILDAIFPAGGIQYNILLYFGVVAISEEGFKYLLMRRRTWLSPAFDCRFDGIVYAVFTSLGFALLENIMYVMTYGFGTAVTRALTAVPGHCCFGVFMGLWYGLAKQCETNGRPFWSRVCGFFAFIVPTLIHGTYDYILSLENDRTVLIFLAFIAVLFFLAFRTVRRVSRNDTWVG